MAWHAQARGAMQRVGLQPRYLRRLRWISKARALRRYGAPLSGNAGFVLVGAEPDNFTYDLANLDELAGWVSSVAGCAVPEAAAYIDEPALDAKLSARLHAATAGKWWWTRSRPPYGKRLGWYALARAVRPRLVVETGVHDGLGSLLLLRALERNGDGGRLVSFDINPAAGWIVGSDPRWELRVESTRDGLAPVLREQGPVGLFLHDSLHTYEQGPVGLFLHDSLHTYEHERFELELAAEHLTPRGVLVSDNAHATPALRELCASRGLRYLEFRERPQDHFYPGGVVGAGASEAPVGEQRALRIGGADVRAAGE